MITIKEQNELFELISKYLRKKIVCYAIGGTAMMFYEYKATTKDIDLVFLSEDDRNAFVDALQELGFARQALADVYDEKRTKSKGKPELYKGPEARFDLFVHDVFGFEISEDEEFVQRHDYPENLQLRVVSREELILLKAITDRPTDFEDIVTIVRTDKKVDWDDIIDRAIAQKSTNEWILIDFEETLRKLKDITFIPEKYFERIYDAQERASPN